nr:NADH:ubiquinone oxidoreductase 27 kD subunit [uncultured archaeon]
MKIEEQTTTPIDVGKLIGRVEQFRSGGYRLVQINATKVGDLYEINYSFDKEYKFENIRITIPIEMEVPSISGMYWGAFVYENEMHDLFGIQVKGINIDYKGNLIKTTIRYPFGAGAVIKGEKP